MTSTAQAVRASDDLFGVGPARPAARVARVAVVGAAGAGTPYLRALAASVPGARVVAVSDDGDPRRLAELATYAGAQALRDRAEVVGRPGVDAVVVAGPDPLPLLMDCLEAGVPAFAVPGRTPEADDLRAVVSLEQATGRRLLRVGLLRRHDPAHLGLRRALDDGGVRLLRVTERGGADVVGAIDTATWLLGASPTRVRRDQAHPGGPAFLTVATPAGTARVEVGGPGPHELRGEALLSDGDVTLATPPGVRVRGAGAVSTTVPADATARLADAVRLALAGWVRTLHEPRGGGVPVGGASTWDWYVAALAAQSALASAGGPVAVDPGPRPSVYDA